MKHFLTAAGTFLAIASAYMPAMAEQKAVFNDWAVHTKKDGGDTICFVLTSPKSKTPTSVNHGEIFFMVASWKSGAASEQPSLITGYSFKSEIPPSANVGGTKIPMFSVQNEAFIQSGNDEKKLVRAMRKGATMRIDAVSARGTQTSYEFSLKGVTAALKKAKSICR